MNHQNIYEGISLLDYTRMGKVTRNAIKKIKPNNNQHNNKSHEPNPRKKVKKQSNPPEATSDCFSVYNLDFFSNTFENTLKKKDLSKIQKMYLPTFIKVIDLEYKPYDVTNTKQACNKKQWIVQAYNSTRKLNENEKIFAFSDICFHEMTFNNFINIFWHNVKDLNAKQKIKLFKKFKLAEKQTILWPVIILHPINFTSDDILIYMLKNKMRDDRSKICFDVAAQSSQQTEIEIENQWKYLLQQPNYNRNIDNNQVFIWYIGSNIYNIIDLSFLSHFNSVKQQILKQILVSTNLKPIQQDVKELLDNYNSKLSKINQVDLKIQDKKSLLRRIIKYKTNPYHFLIVLRYRQNKQIKQILVRSLLTNALLWADINEFKITYATSQIEQDSLKYLYLINRIPEENRIKTIVQYLNSDFYFENRNQYEIFRSYFPDIQNNKKQKIRCKKCYYVLHTLPSRMCFFCKDNYHEHCVSQIDKNFSIKLKNCDNDIWICKKCVPCKICFQIIESAEPLICIQCNSRFHPQCGKLKVESEGNNKYKCQECLKCDMCLKKIKSGQDYEIQNNHIYCTDCIKITDGGYCRICKKSWNNQSGNQAKAQWVQCTCEGWVHRTCDSMLLNNFQYFKNQNAEYNCPNCRYITKRTHLKHIIKILMKFDEFSYFTDPTYESFVDYKQIIANPICFKKILEKCEQGIYDINSKALIVKDINLLVQNALSYNMPKDHSHFSARILKLMCDVAVTFLQNFFEYPDLELITNKSITASLNQTQRQIFKYLYQNYLAIILNNQKTKSKIIVKCRNPPVILPQILYFKSRDMLSNFKNASITFALPLESPKIQHLFSLTPVLQPIKLSITTPVCYYHNYKQIISTCNICCESYCCIRKCFLHQFCKFCGVKGCGCGNWGCGCKPGYNIRDLQNPHLRRYNGNILQITQMYKYCLQCSIKNIKSRQCKYCLKVCSYEFQVCQSCSSRYHKNCWPSKPYIPNYCTECQKLPINHKKFEQMLKQQAKRKIYKILKIQSILPTAMKIFQQECVRIQSFHIKNMLFENFDMLQQYYWMIDNYAHSQQSVIGRKIRQQKFEFIFRSISQFLKKQQMDHRLKSLICGPNFQIYQFVEDIYLPCEHNYYQQDFQGLKTMYTLNFLNKLNRSLQNIKTKAFIINSRFQAQDLCQMFQQENIEEQKYFIQVKSCLTNIKIGLFQLTKPSPFSLLAPQSQFQYHQNNFQIVKYELLGQQYAELNKTVRQLFISFYNEYKKYPRVGSTCLIESRENYILVFKKWSQQKGVTIELSKYNNYTWKLCIDSVVYFIQTFSQLKKALSRFKNFQTLQEVGYFLGFNIYAKKQIQYSYTKFLQTNPLDTESFSERRQKIIDSYQKIKDNVTNKKALFFLKKKNAGYSSDKPNKQPPYFLFEELKKQTQDQPIVFNSNLKITQPTNQIFIAPSTIHKLGLFARKTQQKNTILIQYMGEILSEPLADVRQSQFHLGCYMFGIPKKIEQLNKSINDETVDENTSHVHCKKDIIDATFRGNQARYLNHSCDPNCASKIIEENGRHRILIYAIRDIQEFEQLTYDYQFKVSADDKIVCMCGAKNCQGRLN